jgi:hypothetical protein
MSTDEREASLVAPRRNTFCSRGACELPFPKKILCYSYRGVALSSRAWGPFTHVDAGWKPGTRLPPFPDCLSSGTIIAMFTSGPYTSLIAKRNSSGNSFQRRRSMERSLVLEMTLKRGGPIAWPFIRCWIMSTDRCNE